MEDHAVARIDSQTPRIRTVHLHEIINFRRHARAIVYGGVAPRKVKHPVRSANFADGVKTVG